MPIFNKEKIYNRLPANADEYSALDPFGISVGISALSKYLFKRDNTVQDKIDNEINTLKMLENPSEIQNQRVKFKNNPKHLIHTDEGIKTMKLRANQAIGLEDAKDIYLGLPQRNNTFQQATEFPTNGNLNNGYKSIYLSTDQDILEQFMLPAYRNLITRNTIKEKESKKTPGSIYSIGNSGRNANTFIPILGRATVGYGVDKYKGPYVSYYDNWDVTLSGDSSKDNFVSKLIGGTPFDIYDRIYFKDVYNTPDIAPKQGDYYGTFLPEVIVTK